MQARSGSPKVWRLLADILFKARSLDIVDPSLSTLFQLAKAVAANGRGPLPVREVGISYGVQDLHRSRGSTRSCFSKWAGNAAYLNMAAPSVKAVSARIGPFADEDVGELIEEAIALHQSLEKLVLHVAGGEEAEMLLHDEEGRGKNVQTVSTLKNKMRPGPVGRLLSRAFLEHPCNTSINCLCLRMQTVMSTADIEVHSQVLPMGIHITKFELGGLQYVPSRDLGCFLTKMQVNGHIHLQSLGLFQRSQKSRPELGFDEHSFFMLAEMMRSNSVNLKHFGIGVHSYDGIDYTEAFHWPSFYTALSQMESMSLTGYGGYPQAEKEMLEWIESFQHLQKLDVSYSKSGDHFTNL